MSEEATLDDFAQQDEDSEEKFNSAQPKINLSRLEEYISIIKGTKPDRVNDHQHDDSEPYLVVSTLAGEERKFTPDTDGPKATSQDTLMIMDGSKSGRVYRGEDGVIGSTMAAIRPEGANSHYLRYFLESNFERLNSATKGSAVPHTDKDLLRSLEYPVYPLPEQRKIATILHTVDQAIQKTEEIIEQTKRVKTGVSQHYFEDYNTIRREENPKSVEMVELSNLVDFKPGKAWKTDNLSEEGLKVVRISNLTGQKDEYWRYNSDYEERRVIENGDLLFSWAGMKSSIGVHIYRGEKALLNQHIYNLEPKTSIGRKYLYYYLDYRMSDLYSLSQGGAVQVHLTKDIIERILIPKVPAEKQESMVAHLSEIDNALQNEIARKNRLKRLKRGLMQDLLSGEVRTTDADIDIPEEVAEYG
jgi:type I restriction enzyme S subunit